jgi:hypothetical protein
MESPTNGHGGPVMDALIWIINGLLSLLAAVGAWFFRDIKGDIEAMEQRHHNLSNIVHTHEAKFVTRADLDKKFDELRDDMRVQHQETVDTMRDINTRIDQVILKQP